MKTLHFLSSFTLLGGLSIASAQTLDYRQLPGAVQQAINDQRGPAAVTAIERADRFGTPGYHVQLGPPAVNRDLFITDSGSLINLGQSVGIRPLAAGATQIAFDALPQTVQQSLRSLVGNAAVPNLEQVVGNGQTSYVLPVRLDQRLVDLWLDPTGNVLAYSPPRDLLSGGVRVAPDQLPVAVQETLRSFAAGVPISNVVRGTVGGKTAYDALFNRDGRNVDLRIGEDGSLQRDAVTDRFLADIGQMTRRGLAAVAPTRVPLSDAAPASFNQLPAAVLAAVQRYAGSDFIQQIQSGMASGRRVYEAIVQHAGQAVPLRLGEDGVLVNDRVNNMFVSQLDPLRGVANAGAAPGWQQQSGTVTGR